MTTIVHYTGTDARGLARGGCDSDAAELARKCFEAGWRSLRITAADGREAGGIGPHPDTGRRTWWAESDGQANA